jgi:hypothetical protein
VSLTAGTQDGEREEFVYQDQTYNTSEPAER